MRLRSDFPACAHCLVAEGRGLSATTGSRILDQVRLKHRITAMEPVFGGVHATERRNAAQLRYGRSATGGGAGTLHSTIDLSQIYLVHVQPKTDLLALAAEFRRDPNVVSAEPNYLYSVKSTVDSRERLPLFLALWERVKARAMRQTPRHHSSPTIPSSAPPAAGARASRICGGCFRSTPLRPGSCPKGTA